MMLHVDQRLCEDEIKQNRPLSMFRHPILQLMLIKAHVGRKFFASNLVSKMSLTFSSYTFSIMD